MFGLNLLANFCWHGYEFAVLDGAIALYNAAWFFVEFIAMGLTFVFFSHARKIARRDQRKARDAARAQGQPISGSGESGSSRVRSVA